MIKKATFLIALFSVVVFHSIAQSAKQEIKIQTSAQCEMCKHKIEEALAYERGVVKSNLNLEDKVVTIVFKTNKTSADQLRIVISKLGYDADDIKADSVAYKALPPCCKKPDDHDYIGH